MWSILAFIFAFIFPLLGLIFAFIALSKIKYNTGLSGKGLAITALVISTIWLALVILILLLVFVTFMVG